MKKFLLFRFLLLSLLVGISGSAWAFDVTLTSASQIKNGTFYDASGNVQTAIAWYPKAVTQSPVPITLDFGANTGVSNYNGKLNVYGSKTLTITSPIKITGYTLTGTPTADCTVTPAGESTTNWTAGNSGTVTVSGLDTYTTTIAFTGEADGNTECLIDVTSFAITLSTLTDVSQISTSKYYFVYNEGRDQFMNVNPANGQVLLSTRLASTRAGLLPYIVRFVSNTLAKSEGDAYQLKFYDGTYLPWQSNGSANYVTKTMGNGNNEGYLPTYANGYFNFQVYKGGSSRNYYFNGNDGSFTFWTSSSGSNADYVIFEVDGTGLQEIDYNLNIEGNETSTNSRKLLTLASAVITHPTSTALDDNISSSYAANNFIAFDGTTASGDGSAITIPATWSLPFTTTALVEGEIPADAQFYRMHLRAASANKYARYDSSTGKITYAAQDATLTAADYFCFVGDALTGFKVYNLAAGPSVVMGADNPTTGADMWMLGDGHPTHLWAIHPNSVQGFTLRQTTGTSPGTDAYLHDYSSKFSFWHSSSALTDIGSGLVIEAVDFGDVTYNVLLEANGAVKATATASSVSNRVLSVPASAAKDYCTYTYYTDLACTEEITELPFGTTTVYALASYDMPFAVSTSFAEANWHYATLRGKYLRADDSAKDGSGRYSTNSTNEKTDAYKWAFFGNPYDNFYVMNKNQGDGKYMAKSTQIVFSSIADPTVENTALWAVTPNSNGGFTLRNIDGGANWYVNDAGNGGNLGFWNSSWSANDAGSNWLVITDVTYNVILEPSGQVKATATAENVAPGSALALPSSAARDLCTYTYYSDAACTDEITTVPATGTVYALCSSAIKSAASFGEIDTWYQVRMHSNQTHYMYNNSGALAFNGSFTASNDYAWGFVGNPYDGFNLYNRGAGSTVAVDNADPCTLSAAGTSANFKVEGDLAYIGDYNSTADVCFALYVTSGTYLNYRTSNGGEIKTWTSADEGSTFMINEVRDVNYVLYFGASPVGLQSTIQKVGSATAIPTPLDYCTFAYSDPTIVSGSGAQTVNVTVTMDAPFVPTKYYAWHLMEGNNPGYMYTDGEGNVEVPNNGTLTLTNPIPSAYVWEFTGDPVQGFLIQNMLETSSKTLGGRTASGGTMTMETLNGLSSPRFVPKYVEADRNKWYCQNYDYWIDRSSGKPYAFTGTGYPSTYVRLYKVHFDKGSAPATLMVGTEEIADPSVDIYLSASATMSCKEDGNYITSYDGYETLAEALDADDDGEIVLTIVTSETSVASTDQNKAYNIRTADSRGWWAVASGASVVNSTVGLDIATLSSDTKQQFAFIPIDLDGDTNADEYYLYSIGEQKFVYFNCRSNSGGQIDTHLTLSTAPVKSAVTFTASTNSTHKAVYPNVMTFPYGTGGAGRSFGVHPSHSPQVYNYAHDNTHLDDAGNASSVVEVGAFDPATALSRLPISSTSSLANNKAYAITCPRGVLGINNRTLISTASPIHTFREHTYAGSGVAASITDPTYTEGTFAIIYHDGTDNGEDDGSYYLWSIEGRGYVNSNGVIDNVDPEPIAFTDRGNRTFSIYFPNATKYINLTAWGDNANGLNIDGASGLDDGNRFYICPVDDFDPTDAINIFTEQTVDYVLTFGGDEVDHLDDVSARVSATAEEFFPSSLDNGFMTYTFDPEIITGETATVTVTATWNGPFEIAASFNAATAKWYTVGMHTSYEEQKWTWGYKSGESDKVKAEQLPVNDIANLDNTRLFTFVGDPYSGFDIYNRAAGTKKLYRGGETDEISMTNDGQKFFVSKSRTNPDTQTYFCLKPESATNYLNMNTGSGNVITGWNDNDNASTCWVLPSGSYYLNALTPLVLDAPVGAVGSKSGILTTSDRDALNTLRTDLGTDAFAIPSTTYPFEFVKPIATAVVASDIVALTDGGYYRIVSAVPGFNQTAAWYYNPSVSTTNITWAKAATTTTHQINSLFKFEATGSEGIWHIYSPNAQKYLIHDNTAFEAQTGKLGDTPGDVTVGDVTGSSTQKTLKINVQTVHANGHASGSGNSGTLINYNSNAVGGASTWYLVKVDKIDLTLNKATDLNGRTNVYATAKMPFNITLPTGDDTEAMAYTMLAENQATNAGGVLYIKPDELGRRVPANTPVMLVGTSTGAASQTVRATISDGDMSDVDVPVNNIFVGTYVPLTSNHESDATKYLTLGRNKYGDTQVVGFYLLSDGRTIAANRAYIPYTTLVDGSGVKGFAIAWDFDLDGIENLTEDVKGEKSNVYYDLQGRRVMKPRKGIYIVDGKKVMIK